MRRLLIQGGSIRLTAALNDGPTADALWDALPIEGRANRWGDEIYFEIPVTARETPGARTVMDVGEVAYWPPGAAFCLFFGPTPVSEGSEPRAYSPVNPLGAVEGDAALARGIAQGAPIRLSRADPD